MTDEERTNGGQNASPETPPAGPAGGGESASASAKRIIRQSLTACLATTHHEHATPYASLVTPACQPDGTPVLLLSTLAVHTQNLMKNPNGCLLFQDTAAPGDPLEAGRISVWGRFEETASPRARARFLARHPSAEAYADFSDFSFFALEIESAHFVGGFGRIRPLSPEDLLTDCSASEELMDLEHGFLAHMNKDHAESVSLYATVLLGAPEGDWRLTGIDPAGIDLLAGRDARRLNFDHPVTSPEDMRQKLVSLSTEARARLPHHHH